MFSPTPELACPADGAEHESGRLRWASWLAIKADKVGVLPARMSRSPEYDLEADGGDGPIKRVSSSLVF